MRSRLAWYVEQGCACPEYGAALSVFQDVEQGLPAILMRLVTPTDFLKHLHTVLERGIVAGRIDASMDFLALCIFCAFRKLAVEEVYIEVLDRNPFLGQHSDQAASFAEMFATGAQCETYFDLRPQVLGRLLSEKFRSHCGKWHPSAARTCQCSHIATLLSTTLVLSGTPADYLSATFDGLLTLHVVLATHPPPRPDETDSEQPTVYASRLVDEDPAASRLDPPVWYSISFLSIFAAPALIDILLLSTLGRGLYLSTYMSKIESGMATAALMFRYVLLSLSSC